MLLPGVASSRINLLIWCACVCICLLNELCYSSLTPARKWQSSKYATRGVEIQDKMRTIAASYSRNRPEGEMVVNISLLISKTSVSKQILWKCGWKTGNLDRWNLHVRVENKRHSITFVVSSLAFS